MNWNQKKVQLKGRWIINSIKNWEESETITKMNAVPGDKKEEVHCNCHLPREIWLISLLNPPSLSLVQSADIRWTWDSHFHKGFENLKDLKMLLDAPEFMHWKGNRYFQCYHSGCPQVVRSTETSNYWLLLKVSLQ